jgi:MFS family permease
MGFFVSTFVFYAAGYTLLPTLPLILSARGASPAGVGLVMGAFTASALLFRAPVGMLLARRHPLPLMRFGQAAVGAGFLAYLAAGLWPVALGRVVQGVGLALFNTAAYVYLAERGGRARRAELISLFGLAANVAMAVAPALGSLVRERFGDEALFGTGLGLAAVGLASIPRGAGAVRPTGVARLWEPRAWRPAAAMLGLATGYGTVMVFVPLAVQGAGLSHGWMFFTAYAAAIVATRLVTRRWLDRGSRLRWAAGGAVLMVAALGVLGLARAWPAFFAAAGLFGVGVGVGHPSLMAYLLETVPDEFRSGAAALGTSAFDLGTAGGAALGGLVAGAVSLATAFAGSALLSAVLWLPLVAQRRRTPNAER